MFISETFKVQCTGVFFGFKIEKKKSWFFQAIVSCIISKIIDVRNWAIDFLEAFKNRDWSPKFETGLNIIIGIVQKLKK